MLALPALGFMSPHSMRIAVVLPEPFGPSNPNTSPSRIVKLTSSTAWSVPKYLPRFRTSTTGAVVMACARSAPRPAARA